MTARSPGSWRSSRVTLIAVTSSEAAALVDLDSRSEVGVECTLARRRKGVRSAPAPQGGEFEYVDLLMRTLGAFVRVEGG
jgi:hypothetical protein